MTICSPNHRLLFGQSNTTEDLNIFQCLKQLPSDCPVRHIWNCPLDKMQHISLTVFRSINLLPTKERVHQCINAVTFKFANNNCFFS